MHSATSRGRDAAKAEARLRLMALLKPRNLSLPALTIQKRHVIGHNLGIADEYYAELMQEEQPGTRAAPR